MDAMRTALRLREYEKVLPAEEIYSIIALTAFYARFFGQCSQAFMKLEAMPLKEARLARTRPRGSCASSDACAQGGTCRIARGCVRARDRARARACARARRVQ
eukprot:5706113-Pleurochrysis_carterae.AAC.3